MSLPDTVYDRLQLVICRLQLVNCVQHLDRCIVLTIDFVNLCFVLKVLQRSSCPVEIETRSSCVCGTLSTALSPYKHTRTIGRV